MLPAIKLSQVSCSSSNSRKTIKKSPSCGSQHVAIFHLVPFVRDGRQTHTHIPLPGYFLGFFPNFSFFFSFFNNPQFYIQNNACTRKEFKVWHIFKKCKRNFILRTVESTLKPNDTKSLPAQSLQQQQGSSYPWLTVLLLPR